MPTLGSFMESTRQVIGTGPGKVVYEGPRKLASGKTREGEWTIQLEVEPVFMASNPRMVMKPVANAIIEELKVRLLSGALGTVAPATAKRRKLRDAEFAAIELGLDMWKMAQQEARKARKKRKDGNRTDEFAARAQQWELKKKRLLARFKGPSMLGRFDPRTQSNNLFGCESGLLAKSLAWKISQDGTGLSIRTLARSRSARGEDEQDKKGFNDQGSALTRVLGRRPYLLREVLASAPVVKATQETALRLVATNAMDLLRKLVVLGGSVNDLAYTAGEAGEV